MSDQQDVLPTKVSRTGQAILEAQRFADVVPEPVKPVAWFDNQGKIQGTVSDEQLEALCLTALKDIRTRQGWPVQTLG